jgi:hypothetical protein
MDQNSIVLNRVFSRNTFSSFLKGDCSSAYMSAVRRYVQSPDEKTNRMLISEIYSYIEKNHRNEYFYKNSLLNALLIDNPEHNPFTTVALTEIPIAKSKVDFVLINGQANVYEIKTELDNFDRLETQLRDYFKAFDHVSVVTAPAYEKKVQEVLEKNRYVGIYILSDSGKLNQIRKPEEFRKNLDKTTMFKILRKSEYEEVLIRLGAKLPNVTQFEYYQASLSLFKRIQITRLYTEYCTILKKRCHIEFEKYRTLPSELKAVAYFSQIKNKQYDEINTFLDSTYKEGPCTTRI